MFGAQGTQRCTSRTPRCPKPLEVDCSSCRRESEAHCRVCIDEYRRTPIANHQPKGNGYPGFQLVLEGRQRVDDGTKMNNTDQRGDCSQYRKTTSRRTRLHTNNTNITHKTRFALLMVDLSNTSAEALGVATTDGCATLPKLARGVPDPVPELLLGVELDDPAP